MAGGQKKRSVERLLDTDDLEASDGAQIRTLHMLKETDSEIETVHSFTGRAGRHECPDKCKRGVRKRVSISWLVSAPSRSHRILLSSESCAVLHSCACSFYEIFII